MTAPRYEIKFLLDDVSSNHALNWICRCTQAVRSYPNRHVNSLYFDDAALRAAADNLVGMSDRQKTRLRWYHNGSGNDVLSPQLEIKHRIGRLGYKSQHPLPMFSDYLLKLKMKDLLPRATKLIQGTNFGSRLRPHFLIPCAHVSYLREYYADPLGLRITLDRDIRCYDVQPYARISKTAPQICPYSVLEIKFPTELKDHAIKLIRRSSLSPQRHSKYLASLAAFGKLVYE